MPGPQDDLESMIWVLTYAIMLHRQESSQALKKAQPVLWQLVLLWTREGALAHGVCRF